jgi:predicted RNA binding protein YcfA (HicA-like mRNA interferase family)
MMKVRDILKRLEQDGWYQARMRGSHRVLKHPSKNGIVVVPGSLSDEVAPGTLRSIWKQAQLEDKP